MNILFLRGDASGMNRTNYTSIDQETDVWTELLWHTIRDNDRADVLLWGGQKTIEYSDRFRVLWRKKLTDYSVDKNPDVIISRGGFEEYRKIYKKYKHSKRVWYGANRSTVPGYKCDLVLVDSDKQRKGAEKRSVPTLDLIKPASHIFNPMGIKKKFDICFVAINPSDKRKRVKWVYKNLPKGLKVLQIGAMPTIQIPKNVTVTKAKRHEMPELINKCKCVIAPYTNEDSCPRIIVEAIACNVPVVATSDVNLLPIYTKVVTVTDKRNFWNVVSCVLNCYDKYDFMRKYYERNLSLDVAGKHLRKGIEWI